MNPIRNYRRALASNSNASGFTAANFAPTVTEPVTDAIDISQAMAGGESPRWIKLLFLGLGSDNDAFSVRMIGWNRVLSSSTARVLWQPVIAVEFAVIVGTSVGVAGSIVLATERYADTITIVTNRQSLVHGTDSGGAQAIGRIDVFSPTNDMIGYAIVPLDGYEKLTWDFDQTTGTPTMNVLYKYQG